MKRIGITALACSAILLAFASAAQAAATPEVDGAVITTRTFNDCALSTLTTVNNYPALVSITDVMDADCVGFANLHSFSFSSDGGATPAVFDNNANYHFGADFSLSGDGQGEGGLRISPWYGQFVDGRFMCNVTSGEIACFGGALPFYSFTANHLITYARGSTIRLEATYRANDLTMASPATIQYRVVYNGNTYDSPVLPFGEQNQLECNPHGLWGEMNDARVGGYFQPRANTGEDLTAAWANIEFDCLPDNGGTPVANAAVLNTRTFNDCALSNLTTSNNYPASISISDEMHPDCVGFANLHSWSFSDDGGTTAAVFDNNAEYHFGADFSISGDGQGEGGLRISPWYGQFVDGRFMCNVTSGEIACFGGALPFYSFTSNHAISYVRGSSIRLEATYRANTNTMANPATIQYRVIYNGNTYDSPVLPFGEQNPNECPHGLWGELNDARVGGYFQPRANTGEDLTATWANITYSRCFVAAELEIKPSVVNSKSNGRWVTAHITLPPGSGDVDPNSILLNGSVPVAADGPSSINGNHIKVKFSRMAFLSTLGDGPATVSGTVGCECFQATAGVEAEALAAMPAPIGGQVVVAGSQKQISWTQTGGAAVDIVSSMDNGANWQIVAQGVANSGSYLWNVPMDLSSEARLGVVRGSAIDELGLTSDAELAESDKFVIAGTAGVGEGAVSFALRGISPMPARGPFTVSFSLPTATKATLAMYDVAGRQVLSREVGALGAGQHSITLGQGERLRPGLYLVSLTQGNRKATTRALLIQ